MTRDLKSRLVFVLLGLACVAALGAGVWRYGFGQALEQLAQRGEADLALASGRVIGQLQRHRELAVLMADDPRLASLAEPGEAQAASALLQEVADKTAALEILYVGPDGRVRASARGNTGQDVSHLAFFERAMTGALGSGHGNNILLPRRAYFYAAPQFGPDGRVSGAVIVAADVDEIEWDWTGSNPAVFFTDYSGQVFISNRSELTNWIRPDGSDGLIPRESRAPRFSSYWIRSHEIWRLDWGPYLPSEALHISQNLPQVSFTAEGLLDIAPARRLANLQAAAVMALCLAFGALLFLATERRRTLTAANTRLEAQVAKRTRALSETNVVLRREIAEREEAEAALRQAQEDLVQAGKLSALGQMSAGISHELNQPLMAIRSFAENARSFLDRDRPEKATENLGRISDLAERMARIIRNLRAFARQENAPVARVDLLAILDSAIDLSRTRLDRSQVDLQFNRPSENPIWVRGGEVRLSQVFLNLISNAIDAMAATETRRIEINVSKGNPLTVSVRDTGPGIDVPDKVFEPFYSTKSDQTDSGMGLGLSISYGIVQSFGGTIRGANSDDGEGAVFTVELERWRDQEAAA